MNKPSPLIWMVVILLLILPSPAGKFIVDLAGGIFLLITLIPLIFIGVGWLAWKRIKSKVETCEKCGSNFINNQTNICPICGQAIRETEDILDNIPASAATIDIKPKDID